MGEKELVRVTDVTYEDDDDLIVKMIGRTRDGRRVVKDIYKTEPYMFVPESATPPESLDDELQEKIVDVRSGYESYDNVPLLQIVTQYPSDISDIRKEYEKDDRYESDLIYERRCTADYGLSGYVRVPKSSSVKISEVEDVDSADVDEPVEPRICIADIEVEVPDVFTDDFSEEAPNEVQAITCYDSYDEEYTLFCLDPERQVDPGEIRDHIEAQWFGESKGSELANLVWQAYTDHADDALAAHLDEWQDPERFKKYVKERAEGGQSLLEGSYAEALDEWETDEFADFVDHFCDRLTADEDVDATNYTQAPISFKRFADEKSLLQDYVRYLQEKRPDVVTGWNYVQFDHEYLVNRIRNKEDLNVHALSDVGAVGGWMIERFVPGMPAVDMMAAMKKILYGNRESWSLDYISHDMLGVGKIEGDDNAYDKNRSKFMAYNVVDVQLCVALDDVQAILQFWYQVAEICSIPIYSVGSTMKECEGYLFKHRGPDEILPATNDEDVGEISGGFVMPPSKGVKDYVGVTDLKSLYPSSIISCNISRETITRDPQEADVVVPDMPLNYESVDGDITWDDIGWELGEGTCVGFDLSQQGILPKYLKLLFFEREELKGIRNQYDPSSTEYDRYNNQQRAVKVIMNSFFGVSDNQYFRLSEEGLGDAITAASRFVQWFGVQQIEDQGYDVIYGDTDSLMVELVDSGEDAVEQEDVIQRGLDLEENLNAKMSPIADEFGIPDDHPHVDLAEMPHNLPDHENHLWQYEFEKLYRRFFQAGSKKRYAGWVVWKEGKEVDDIDTVGMESERSDSPSLAKDVQTDFIELVLKSQGFDELSSFINTKVEKIREFDYSVEDIGLPSTINKPVDEYPNRPMPRAVRHANKYVPGYDWGVGDDPWLVYVDSTPEGQPMVDVIALSWTDEDVPNGFQMDVEEHIHQCVKQPTQDVIGELDYTWSELKTGKKQQSVLGGSSGGGDVSFGDEDDDGEVTVEFGDESDTSFDDPFEDEEPQESKEEGSAFDW